MDASWSRRAVLGASLAAAVAAGCTRDAVPPDPTRATPPSDPPAVIADPPPTTPAAAPRLDLASPRPELDHPDTLVRAGAAGRFVECSGPVALGGWTPDVGADGGGADRPDEAVDAFLGEDSGLAGLPARGYSLAGVDHGRALFTYSVEGSVKAALVVADTRAGIEVEGAPAGWIVEVFAACDISEFATADLDDAYVTVWRDEHGDPVSTDILHSHPGPEHCDWESVTFLWLEGRQYLRDPDGVLHASTLAPFLARATLPDDASDTGYRAGIAELWHAADGSRVYLVTEERVEAWSATTERVGCR